MQDDDEEIDRRLIEPIMEEMRENPEFARMMVFATIFFWGIVIVLGLGYWMKTT